MRKIRSGTYLTYLPKNLWEDHTNFYLNYIKEYLLKYEAQLLLGPDLFFLKTFKVLQESKVGDMHLSFSNT